MTHVFNDSGTRFQLDSRIASGGEGTVFRIANASGYCVKIYHGSHLPDPEKVLKLSLLKAKHASLEKYAALPGSLAYSDPTRKKVVGIFIKFIDGLDIFELYNPSSRSANFPDRKFNFLIHVGYNLSLTFKALHQADIILGDVSEKNIKIREDGTVTLIDCDSFQVSFGNRTLRCPVGTPIWTAPELQGNQLDQIDRTVNHDNFGLAQLIFLLLFAGRYPYSGVSIGHQEIQVEEAIRRYAFAYDPRGNCSLSPPPGAPPLSLVPDYLQKLFLRAFCEGSQVPGARPSPSEWLAGLDRFKGELAKCTANSEHLFWERAPDCPWCILYRKSGWDFFPPPSSHPGANSNFFNYRTMCEALSSLNFDRICLVEPPVVVEFQFRLPPKPKGIIAAFKKSCNHSWWVRSWLMPELARVRARRRNLATELDGIRELSRRASVNFNLQISGFPTRVASLRSLLSNPEFTEREIETQFHEKSRSELLKAYLSKFSVLNSNIEGIGESRAATLANHGIFTAADIEPSRILRIPGFGSGLLARLAHWRRQCEGSFKYDKTKPFPPNIQREIKRATAIKLAGLSNEALEIINKTSIARTQYQSEMSAHQNHYTAFFSESHHLSHAEIKLVEYLNR